MTIVNAYAAPGASQDLIPTTIARREIGDTDVQIDIMYAGICHSDIHTVRDEWGPQIYPLTPGHEIIGQVSAIGGEVTRFQVGDMVGVGCMVNSCRTCDSCAANLEQYCLNGFTGTYGEVDRDATITQGGYSQMVVVDEHFVVSIPAGVDLAATTPLLCAGITLYSPLRHWGAGPGKRVAILGMGGLGHVGVKIAAAMGAEVSVISHSLSKKADGLRFGATHYLATSNLEELAKFKNYFDLILNTVSVNLDLDLMMGLLRTDGTLVELGLPTGPLVVGGGTILPQRRSLAGSNIGGMAQTQEMLEFCAQHSITAEIEMIEAKQINEAYARVVDSQVRYRFVIDAQTFGQ